jgi:hypothetical protein
VCKSEEGVGRAVPEYETKPLAATRVVVAIEASDAVTSFIVSLLMPKRVRWSSEEMK